MIYNIVKINLQRHNSILRFNYGLKNFHICIKFMSYKITIEKFKVCKKG